MKLDSIGKRIGVILILAAIAVFVILILAWVFMEPQFIAYHLPNGNVIYYKRGIMEAMVAEWLGMTLVALPLFLCGVALTLGYGGKLWQWVKYGSPEEENSGEGK